MDENVDIGEEEELGNHGGFGKNELCPPGQYNDFSQNAKNHEESLHLPTEDVNNQHKIDETAKKAHKTRAKKTKTAKNDIPPPSGEEDSGVGVACWDNGGGGGGACLSG